MSEIGKMSFFIEDVDGNRSELPAMSTGSRAAQRVTDFLDSCEDGRLFMSSTQLARVMGVGENTPSAALRTGLVAGYWTRNKSHPSARIWGNKATIAAFQAQSGAAS